MAKKTKIPKEIAGFKVPKSLRRSKMLKHLLSSSVGRKIVADALIAGAGAGAATLVAEREQVTDASGKAVKRSKRTIGVVGEAIENAADAVMQVIADAARSLAPDDKRGGKRSDDPASVRH